MSDKQTKEESAKNAKTFLIGNLVSSCVTQLKTMDSHFNNLSEAEQKLVIKAITDDVTKATKKAVSIISADQRVSFLAEVSSVNFTDGIVKAVLKIGNTQESHLLADVAGATILVVLEDSEDIFASLQGVPVATPDQQSLKSV